MHREAYCNGIAKKVSHYKVVGQSEPQTWITEAKKRKIELICDRTSQLSFKIKNGWLKYDIRVMYKKYTTPLPIVGCGVVEIHLEMAQPTNKKDRAL